MCDAYLSASGFVRWGAIQINVPLPVPLLHYITLYDSDSQVDTEKFFNEFIFLALYHDNVCANVSNSCNGFTKRQDSQSACR